MYSILMLSYLAEAFAKDCSLLSGDYKKIVAKNSEIIVYPISQLFYGLKYGDDLKLIDPDNKLTLIPPIELKSSANFDFETPLQKFLTFSVFTNTHYDWLNKFQLLGHTDSQYMILSTTQVIPGIEQRRPVFNTQYLLDYLTEATYYSSVIYDIGRIIIDCSTVDDQEVQTNYFYLLDEMTQAKIKIPNTYPYTKQQRQIQISEKFIYRATLSNDQNPSIVEIFSLDLETNTVSLWNIINQEFILKYVTNIIDYKFELQDFKIGKQDEIVLLDKLGNLLFFQYSFDKSNFYFKNVATRLGQSISFDFDFYRDYFVVVQPNRLISYFQQSYGSYQTADDISAAKVHIGKDMIFLTSSTQSIQFNKQLDIVFKLQGDFSEILSDFNQNDFVAIDSNIIKHYQMYQSYSLQYISLELTAGTGTLIMNGCSITIDYQNLAKNSKELIQVSKQPIIDTPLFTNIGTQQDTPRHLVDGPNQKLDLQKQNDGNLSQIIYQGDDIINSNFQSADIIFIKTVEYQFSSDQSYYIVTQNINKKLKAFYCELIIFQNCSISWSIQLSLELNDENTIVQSIFGYLTVGVLQSQTKLVIYKFKPGELNPEYTYDINEEYQIDSLFYNQNKVILFSKNLKTFTVYLFDSTYLLYVISPKDLKILGITEWNPTRVFTNDIDGLVYILNGDQQILIIKLELRYYWIVYTKKISTSKDIKIINFKQRFCVIQLFDEGQISLDIFNKIDETNIFLEKSPSQYTYKITDLNKICYTSQNGILYINAQRDLDNSTIVLTYFVDETDHNSLHSVVVVDADYKFLTCTKYNTFIFDEKNVKIMQIQPNPQIMSKIKFDDNTFVTDVQYDLVYFNEMNLTISQKFRLVNTQIEVKINESKLNITTNLTSNIQDHYIQNMGVDWYSGQAYGFEFFISQLHDEVTIINPIELVKNNYSNDSKGIADLDADYIFLLKDEEFVIMSKSSNSVVKTYQFLPEYLCQKILGYNTGQLVLQCSYETKVVIVGVKCEGLNCTLGTSSLQINENIVRAQIEDNTIFLLYQQRVDVYNGSVLSLDQSILCGFEDFSDLDNYQYGIAIQKIHNIHYHIYSADYYNNLIIMEYVLSSNKFTRNNKFGFDLAALIKQDFYLLKGAFILYIQTINVEILDTSFKADYLLFSYKGPHYGIHMEFECSNGKCQLQEKRIAFVLQDYGQYLIFRGLFPQIIIRKQLVIIPYLSSPFQDKAMLVVYNLPIVQTTKTAISFLGAVTPTYYFVMWQIIYECYFYGDQPYLLTNVDQEELSLYKINSSPQFMLNGDIKSSFGLLNIQNDYSSDQVVIMINSLVANDDNSKSSRTAIWVISGIVGGLIIIGAGYYCLKKKQQKDEILL